MELREKIEKEIEDSTHHLELAETEKDGWIIRGHITGLQRVLSFLPGDEEEEVYICDKCGTSPALPHQRFCVACARVKDISGSGW